MDLEGLKGKAGREVEATEVTVVYRGTRLADKCLEKVRLDFNCEYRTGRIFTEL